MYILVSRFALKCRSKTCEFCSPIECFWVDESVSYEKKPLPGNANMSLLSNNALFFCCCGRMRVNALWHTTCVRLALHIEI